MTRGVKNQLWVSMQMWGERSQITPSPAFRPEQTPLPPQYFEVKQKAGVVPFNHEAKKSVIVDTRWKHTISEQTLVAGVCGELSSTLLTVNLSCLSHPFDQPGEHILQSGLGLLFNFKGLNMSPFGSFSLGLITEVFAQLHLFRNKWQLSLLKQSRANK